MQANCPNDAENESSNHINMAYNYDWSTTSLGPIDSWDPTIKTAFNICLQSAFPITIFVPPDWNQFYNEACIPIIKAKHPYVFGKPTIEGFYEAAHFMIPEFESVREKGKGIFKKDNCAELQRDGYIEETYFDYTMSPIFKKDGTFCGIFSLTLETTQRVLNTRRLSLLGKFGHQISDVKSLESACRIITNTLRDNNADIPYALIYFIEHKSTAASESLIARLISTTFDDNSKNKRRFPEYFPETHELINLNKDSNKSHNTYIELKRTTATYSFLKCESWPIYLAIKDGQHVKVLLKDESQAVLLPIKISSCKGQVLSVVLICGINRRCTLDEQYMEFLQLVKTQVNAYLQQGNSVEEEKKSSNILINLNSQKIMFFQGISHELKTPLTLMLSPLDDVINECPQEAPIMSYLQTIRRNSRRLLKLVNTLLQFSNMETDQLEANYRETNIAEFTRELVSDFENMAKSLGLDYIIDIPHSEEFIKAVGDNVYLDHEMYEIIIFNLCSNAIKHTWNGRITIRLYIDYKDDKRLIVFEISDTGVGIPKIALPNIFNRFYRVESQGSRSHEGTGIGLSLVKEFIIRHGGDITVTSVVNQGTTFKCWFPIGCMHLPANQIRFNEVENPISHGRELYTNRQLYLEESSQWIKNNTSEAQDDIIMFNLSTNDPSTDDSAIRKRYQILLVDDNADMRDYLSDLLKEFDIRRACDGQEALRVLEKLPKLPDLILSDVMMPNMNGYQLLEVLRSDIKTQLIPVILLSAKASEESKITGLDKGADDYLTKPFSARELIARIRANIELSLLRRKILFQQCKQEETKQLLLSITDKILSGLGLKETLQYVVKEIYHRITSERVFIILKNERSKIMSNRIIAIYEDSISLTSPLIEISDNNKSKSQITDSPEFLNNNSGIEIFLDKYSDHVHKNASILSVEIKLKNDLWGWIKLHRSPNSIWLDSEIELVQQISNQISLAITHESLLEENSAKEIQIKAIETANNIINQVLANTSHELRTPLGAIVGILSSFDCTNLTTDQKDMINIVSYASDTILSIVNNILYAAKLEAQKIILINRTFDLLELFEDIIEAFGKRAIAKNIELIVNCDVDGFPRYVKSDPDRVKFTEKGEIILTISMQSQNVIDMHKESPTYGQTIIKGNLLVELCDTGIGMDPEYIKHAWKRFSQGDTSITRKQDGTGLGLSICKSLVEINGGEINAVSQLGKGSKFWFTWNIELSSSITSTLSKFSTSSLLETKFDEQINYVLPHVIRQKRVLIIHPIESVRNAMLIYLKRIEKVDAFDTFDKGIFAAKVYKGLYNRSAYDIVFISLYKNNEEEAIKAALELKELEMNNNLVIIFIVFSSKEVNELTEKLYKKVGGTISIIYAPITWKKLINQFINIE
ncbi:9607_t:CDS:10 [Scutellospora calospora]|uniref:9607_t:CDS:1 n=1 Tax=Scutellospora calospora TaxID=85575 RepID=A0ACA9JYQ9_9GLOM|nr:9607_t:CDS:10 [Scutellospora calospora]